jgi:hypothetical protein
VKLLSHRKVIDTRDFPGVIFSPFLVFQAQKRKTSPDTTGTTSEDESKGATMKKEDLVAKGLSDAHAQIAVDAYNEEIKDFIPKTRFDEVNGQLKTANSTIDQLKNTNKDNEALQAEVTKYKDQVRQMETAAANTQKEYALKDKLKEAGVTDVDYIIYKQGGLDKFTFDKDGKPVGVDDVLKPLRETSPHLFKQNKGGYDPAGGGTPPAGNPFAKETWNMTKQGELFKADPAQARQMAAAAGVKL